MKKIIISVLVAMFFVSCKNENSKTDADSTMQEIAAEMSGMKSYIIQYKQEMKAEGVKSTSLLTQYVDLKNQKFAIESEGNTEMTGVKNQEKTLTLIADNWTYIINLNEKTGIKMKDDESEDNPKNMIKSEDDLTFREMIEKEGGKIVGNEMFLNKNCIVAESFDDGMTTKMWYYKGIPLKIENEFYNMEATNFEENASIPASKFAIPDGIKFMEMPTLPEIGF